VSWATRPARRSRLTTVSGDEREERMRELAREFVDSKVGVIAAAGTDVFASHSVTITVPIVAAVAGDLVEVGLANSLGHPGGNVTGKTLFYELTVKRIALLKQVQASDDARGRRGEGSKKP
jgi:putative ABC transport system substrate-binding protein